MCYVFIVGSLNREPGNENKFSVLVKKKQFAFNVHKKAFLTTFLLKQCLMAREKK